jgi:hypothetical protein
VSCLLGKSKPLPFSESSNESITTLEIIHFDVWSTSCLHYVVVDIMYFLLTTILTFVGYFHFSNKSNVYSTFVKFKL